jgi:membrane protein required for colicin V production
MGGFTWMDGLILTVIAISTLISIVRGFMKETLSLMSWFASFYLAYRYYDTIAAQLAPFISHNSMRFGLSFMMIFIGCAILFGTLTYFVLKILKVTGMNTFDRMFGAAFGAARGLLIVNLLILVGSTLSLTGYMWWKQSYMIKHLTPQVVWLKKKLPKFNKQFQDYVNRDKLDKTENSTEYV